MAKPVTAKLALQIERHEATQGRAADRLGISEGHLSDLLRGRRTPSLALAIRIEQAYGIPASAWTQTA